MGAVSLEAYRRRREDAPWEVIRASHEWAPVVKLFDVWARDKLNEQSGYSSSELDAIERVRGVKFPRVLREWWRLAGKHPFIDPGLDEGVYMAFALPVDEFVGSQDGLTRVTYFDTQSGNLGGIHDDFLDDLDPITHGQHECMGAKDFATLPIGSVYKNEFLTTGSPPLTVPALIHVTLLCLLTNVGHCADYGAYSSKSKAFAMLVPTTVFVRPIKNGHSFHDDDLARLGLVKVNQSTAIGKIHTNGHDIIFYWLTCYLCLNTEAADRVRRAIGIAS